MISIKLFELMISSGVTVVVHGLLFCSGRRSVYSASGNVAFVLFEVLKKYKIA